MIRVIITFFAILVPLICFSQEAIIPVNLLPVNVSPYALCEDSEFKVTFSTNKLELDTGTKFWIRLYPEYTTSGMPQFLDAPAILVEKGLLSTRFPTGFGLKESQTFKVGIVTENPAIIAQNTLFKILVYPKLSVNLKTNVTPSINLGEEIQLFSNALGMYPFTITLNTGQETTNYGWTVKPDNTTTYQIKSIESGCGFLENPPHQPLTITVKPSLYIPVATTVQRFCEGQTARIPFKAVGVNSSTSYSIEATTNNNEKFVFPATSTEGFLDFNIPKNSIRSQNRDYGQISSIRIISSNPSLASPMNYGYRIQSEPYILLAENSKTGVSSPSVLRMDYVLFGGAPFELEMADGSRQINDYREVWFQQFIKKDTIFKISAISNQCFKNSDLPAFPLKVSNPADATPNLFLRLVKTDVCMGDSVEVEAFFNGQFQAGNEFTLSYLKDAQVDIYPIMKITRPGKYKLKLPSKTDEGYTASLMLSSSLPRLVSETARFNFTLKPGVPFFSPIGTKAEPAKFVSQDGWRLNIYFGKKSTLNYTLNGQVMAAKSEDNGTNYLNLDLPPNQVSEFKILSATNFCGTYTGEIVSYYYRPGYSITLPRIDLPNKSCIGAPFEIPFSIGNGRAAAGTRFTLQIASQSSSNPFTDLVTVSDLRRFSFKVPDLPVGYYKLRVRSSDEIFSEEIYLSIGKVPSAIFRMGGGTGRDTTVFVDYGSSVALATSLTGSDPWGIVYNDGTSQGISSPYLVYYPIITSPQTFSIDRVWNSCGFGTVTGAVTVKVKPALQMTNFPANSGSTLCPGQIVQLEYDIKGTTSLGSDYLVFSLVDDKQQSIKLDSTKNLNGRISLKLPAALSGQSFRIFGTIASVQVQRVLNYQLYVAPDITLSGDNLITVEQSTKLFVRANNTFANNTSFELSDGSIHTFISPVKGREMEIAVYPAQTTTYTLKELKTVCGVGKTSGSATITVQPRLTTWLEIQSVYKLNRSKICGSDTVLISFASNNNTFGNYEILLSDTTGKNFLPITTFGSSSPVQAVIPENKSGGLYRLRLTSTNPQVSGSTFFDRINVGKYATARVVTPAIFYTSGQPAAVVIGFEGSTPFNYSYGDDNFKQYRSTNKTSDTIRFTPISPIATYKILSVANECGAGKIGTPSAFRIELITGTEPVSEMITFGPNPTADEIFLQFTDNTARDLNLFDSKGVKRHTEKIRRATAYIDMKMLPSGIYLLRISKNNQQSTYRIVKN